VQHTMTKKSDKAKRGSWVQLDPEATAILEKEQAQRLKESGGRFPLATLASEFIKRAMKGDGK
jgi:hypothetical protein